MKIDAGRIGKCLLEEAVFGRNVSTTHRLNRKRTRTAQLGNSENAGCWAFGVANSSLTQIPDLLGRYREIHRNRETPARLLP